MNSKDKIIQSSEDLFLRYGIKSISMDDIARHLGISKKTLYQHVENKRDLISQVLTSSFEVDKHEMSIINGKAQNAIEEIVEIAKYTLQILRRVSPTVIFDLQKYYKQTYTLWQEMHSTFVKQSIQANIEWGIKDGLYRENLNPDIIAKLYVGKTLLVIDQELFPPNEYNKETLFTQYIIYHLHGIASKAGLKKLSKYAPDEHI